MKQQVIGEGAQQRIPLPQESLELHPGNGGRLCIRATLDRDAALRIECDDRPVGKRRRLDVSDPSQRKERLPIETEAMEQVVEQPRKRNEESAVVEDVPVDRRAGAAATQLVVGLVQPDVDSLEAKAASRGETGEPAADDRDFRRFHPRGQASS